MPSSLPRLPLLRPVAIAVGRIIVAGRGRPAARPVASPPARPSSSLSVRSSIGMATPSRRIATTGDRRRTERGGSGARGEGEQRGERSGRFTTGPGPGRSRHICVVPRRRRRVAFARRLFAHSGIALYSSPQSQAQKESSKKRKTEPTVTQT